MAVVRYITIKTDLALYFIIKKVADAKEIPGHYGDTIIFAQLI